MNTTTTKIAGEAMTDEQIRKSMTGEQIRLERKLTCEAIDGAMAFGYQNTNPPPSDDHWLAPYWKIGRKQAEMECALLASKPAVPQTLSDGAQYFACYLIDNCENEVIREESVQAWLGKMLASPRYHPTAPAQSCGDAEQADEADGYKLAGYLVDPGAGSAMDRFQTWKPDAVQLADVQRRGGSVTELFARSKDSK
jgi:hypothetical protein